VRVQPGDTSGLAVRSWTLDGDRRDLTMVSRGDQRVRRPTPSYSEDRPILL